jgi:hypothetical protein
VPRLFRYNGECTTYEDWVSRFGTLRPIAAEGTVDETYELVKAVVDAKLEEHAAAEQAIADAEADKVRQAEEAAAAEAERLRLQEEEQKRLEEEDAQVEADYQSQLQAWVDGGKKGKEPPKDEAEIRARLGLPEKVEKVEEVVEEKPEIEPDHPNHELRLELANIVHTRFHKLKDDFHTSSRQVFRSLRKERRRTVEQFANDRRDYTAFLRAGDDRQKLVDQFQLEFNSVEPDMQVDEEMKAEMHRRADELRDSLWDICDNRRVEAETERQAVIDNGFVDDHLKLVAMYMGRLMQCEADRFSTTATLIADYYAGKWRKVPPKEPPVPRIEVASVVLEGTKEATNRVNVAKGIAAPDKGKAAPAKGKGAPAKGAPPPEEEEETETGPVYLKEQDQALIDGLKQAAERITESQTPHMTKRKAEEEALPEGETLPELEPQVQAQLTEEQILVARVERVVARFKEYATDVRMREKQLHDRMDRMLIARYRAEMDAVSVLSHTIKNAIEMEQRLPYELRLVPDYPPDRLPDFLVDEDTLFQELPKKPELVIEEVQQPFRPTLKALAQFTEQLRALRPAGFISVIELVELLARAGTSQDWTLVPEWGQLNEAELAQLIAPLDVHGMGVVDWRSLIIALSMPSTPQPADLIDLRQAFNFSAEGCGLPPGQAPLDANKDTTSFWFQRSGFEPTAETIMGPNAGVAQQPVVEMGKGASHVQPIQQVPFLPAKLRDLYISMFTLPAVADKPSAVAFDDLLMHLCVDETNLEGMTKAAAILAMTPQTNSASVTLDQLAKIVWSGLELPDGSTPQLDVFNILSTPELEKLFVAANELPTDSVLFAKLLSTPAGQRVVQAAEQYKRHRPLAAALAMIQNRDSVPTDPAVTVAA